jgi:arylsulfatase A-like enzyme
MRGLIVSMLVALPLIGTPSLPSFLAAAEAPRPRNVLLFVADGLRPGTINEQTAPAMAALLKRGVTFTNTHSMFPTLTMSNAAAMATGHMLGDTGAYANTIYVRFPARGADSSVMPFLESDPVLDDINEYFGGNFLNEETILHAAAAAGLSTASIGQLGPSMVFDHTARTGLQTIVVDDLTGHPGGLPLSSEIQLAFQEFSLPAEAPTTGEERHAKDAVTADMTVTATPAANGARRTWFADVATLALLPAFRDRHKPFLIVFWSHEPANTPGDPPLRLVPGINGPASLAEIKNADNDLARLLTTLKELGLDSTTDVILASDHGFSTISKETATSYAASPSYKDVPKALLPPGFLAIDLAHALRMSLFDPDAPAATRDTPLPVGSFPIKGNGLIGDEAAHPQVVVAANGGSDLIYLPDLDKLMAARIVQILAAQDYVSGLFVDSRLGSIGGTLPLSAVALEGTASTPAPAIVVSFRTFSTGCADPAACGVAVSDTVLQQGQGASGSFGRADTKTVMGAAGPGFRTGFQDSAPVSTADIGKTIAAMLGLKVKDKGKLSGRVLTEAMPNGAAVFAKSGVLKSAPDDTGRVTELRYQTVGTTRYFDAAGYSGRTLGLD